jgi:hypothetical protein
VVSVLFRFRDDVSIRTETTERGTLLHARSASRVGKGDLCANARHLLALCLILGGVLVSQFEYRRPRADRDTRHEAQSTAEDNRVEAA